MGLRVVNGEGGLESVELENWEIYSKKSCKSQFSCNNCNPEEWVLFILEKYLMNKSFSELKLEIASG